MMKRYGGKISSFLHHPDMHQPVISLEGGIFWVPPPGTTLIQAHWVTHGKI
jgi:hypothetical protein